MKANALERLKKLEQFFYKRVLELNLKHPSMGQENQVVKIVKLHNVQFMSGKYSVPPLVKTLRSIRFLLSNKKDSVFSHKQREAECPSNTKRTKFVIKWLL